MIDLRKPKAESLYESSCRTRSPGQSRRGLSQKVEPAHGEKLRLCSGKAMNGGLHL